MSHGHIKRQPGFFWQGLLIVLPVLFLAGLGLVSVREDQRLAEQDARERAGEIVRGVATDIAPFLGDRLARVQATASAKERAFADWSSAEANLPDAPEISAPESFFPPARMASSGEWIFPREWSSTPMPPRWLETLTPEQSAAWTKAQALDCGGAPTEEVTAAWDAFLAIQPGAAASAVAELALLRLQTLTKSATETVERFLQFGERNPDVLSESGLPLGAVSFGLALRRTEVIDEALLRGLAGQIERPSILTPYFLSEVNRGAVNSTPEIQRTVNLLEARWKYQERFRESLRHLGEQAPWDVKATNLWFDAPFSRWLAMIRTEATATADGAPVEADETIVIHLVPKEVFREALVEAISPTTVPPYFALNIQVEGEELITVGGAHSNRQLRESALLASEFGKILFPRNNDSKPGAAADVSETIPLVEGNETGVGAGFQVAVYLADPAALFARQRRRAMWFGALILAAAVAALAGFIRARRAFLREHQLNALKSNFVSSVSHELRAPIASVRLMAESLERGKVHEPAKQREYFRFMVQECRRLSALIANVLDFSRIEQGRKQYDFEPTDLIALVQETVALMQPQATQGGIKLEVHLEPGSPSDLQPIMDSRAVQQALINLLDNALKHSPPGGVIRVGVSVAMAPFSKMVLGISVADEGPGIPAPEHDRIFERFYRIGSELRRETQGVGIGLSIVKHTVEAHGGRVHLESEPGKGSRFTMEFPLPPEQHQSSTLPAKETP